MSTLLPASGRDLKSADLQAEIKEAQGLLLEAEADLAREQANVNAFRMHCRLKLDHWINRLLELQTEKQRLLTRLELLRQAAGYGRVFDEEDPFWQGEAEPDEINDDDEDELLLPTDTPRDKAAEQRLFRQLARRYHPDLATTAVEVAFRTDMMAAVNIAYSAGDVQALYDLADQIEPSDLIQLASIEQREIRELQTQLIRLRQRKRRVKRRLVSMRDENTARLWQKAKRLDTDDKHWWEVVRLEIEAAIQRVEGESQRLREQIEVLDNQVDIAAEAASEE